MNAATNHSERLRQAGIDPTTNVGMAEVTHWKKRFPGCVLLYRFAGRVFAFGAGGDAAIVRQAMGRAAVWETIESVDDVDREQLVKSLVAAGYRVVVVAAKEPQ